MKLSTKLRIDNDSGKFGKALSGYSEEAESLEMKIAGLQVELFNYRYHKAIDQGASHEQAKEHAKKLEEAQLMEKTMYEFGNTILDLTAIIAIQWDGDTCSILVMIGSGSIYLRPSYKDTDNQDAEYEEICDLRHKELVAAWKEAKGL